MAHAPLAPSAAHRWMHCPGSTALTRDMPDTAGAAASEGTFAHAVAATCLDEGTNAVDVIGLSSDDPATMLDPTEIVGGPYVVDEEMAAAVQDYLDVVRGLSAEGSTHVEVRVTAVPDTVYGTADAVVLDYAARTIHVVDLKYGSGVYVDVRQNPQLLIYAVGALRTLNVSLEDFDTVQIHVVQPRHYRGGHTTETVEVEWLLQWAEVDLADAVEATTLPDAPLATGDWCMFCPAKKLAACPEMRRVTVATAGALFADETLRVPAKNPPRVDALSVDEIATILDAAPVIEEWITAVRERAYTLADHGTPIPRRKLVAKFGHRKWVDPEAARSLLQTLGVDPFEAPKLKSPAQVEKVLNKKARDIVSHLTLSPETGTVLVPEGDARPAIQAGNVFLDSPVQ